MLYVFEKVQNTFIDENLCFNQDGTISSLNGKLQKLVD